MSIASWTSPPASAAHLPHLARHQVGQLVLVLAQELAEPEEDLAALRRRHEPPVLERRLRRRDRAVDVGGARARERRERLAGRGDERLEGLAALGADPLAADEVLETLRGQPSPRRSLVDGSGSAIVRRRERARSRAAGGGRASRAARARLLGRPAAPPVGPVAPVDDHGHRGVVGVVRDEPVEELGLELARDDAVDHALSLRPERRESGCTRRGRCRGRCGRPRPCARSTR